MSLVGIALRPAGIPGKVVGPRLSVPRSRPAAPIRGTLCAVAGPARVDVDIYQGDDWALWTHWWNADGSPWDVGGMVWRAQIRASSADADQGREPLAEPLCTVVDAAGGVLTVTLDHDSTEALGIELRGQRGHWDLQAEDAGTFRTYLAGLVTVTREVTR